MRSSFPLAAVAAGLLLFASVGCTGTDTRSDEGATDGLLAADDSPLQDYIDLAWYGGLTPEEQERKSAQWDQDVDALVALCMKEQGFEYTPATGLVEEVDEATKAAEAEDAASKGIADEWKPDDREWVAQYGYGAIDFPGSELDPDSEEVRDLQEEAAASDPNIAYYESLPESAKAAYDEALNGPPVDKDNLGPSEEWDWREAGCSGRAAHELEGDGDDEADLSEFGHLIDQMNQVSNSQGESPEFAEIDAKWSSCMADAGESGFTKQVEAAASIYAQLDDLQGGTAEGDTPADGENFAPIDASSAEVEAIRQREVELALIDLDCREETDYTQASLKIQFAIEEQFIKDHKAELDAFKLAAEQAG